MSMSATFVQVDGAELARIEKDPSMAEALFHDGPMIPPVFAQLNDKVQERLRTVSPEKFAAVIEQLDPRLREVLAGRLGKSTADLSSGGGIDALSKLMNARSERANAMASLSGQHEKLSLDKSWHGVHYVLCGEVEPGSSLLSQPVMGGESLGDEDDEGFSGYGPARFFAPAKVAELAEALKDPALETEAAERFDAAKMTKLEIYPGWRPSDAAEVMDAFRSLRSFYADAASKKHGIVTCLV